MGRKSSDLSELDAVKDEIVNNKVYVTVGSFMWRGDIINCEYDKIKKRSFIDIEKAVKKLKFNDIEDKEKREHQKEKFFNYISRISLK